MKYDYEKSSNFYENKAEYVYMQVAKQNKQNSCPMQSSYRKTKNQGRKL